MDMEARLTELEIAQAHQERTLSELNAVVIAQAATIDTLKAEVERLKEQLVRLLDSEPLENARPPHY